MRAGKTRSNLETLRAANASSLGKIGFELVDTGSPTRGTPRITHLITPPRESPPANFFDQLDHLRCHLHVWTSTISPRRQRLYGLRINLRSRSWIAYVGDDLERRRPAREHLFATARQRLVRRLARGCASPPLPVPRSIFGWYVLVGVRRSKSGFDFFVRFGRAFFVRHRHTNRCADRFPLEHAERIGTYLLHRAL